MQSADKLFYQKINVLDYCFLYKEKSSLTDTYLNFPVVLIPIKIDNRILLSDITWFNIVEHGVFIENAFVNSKELFELIKPLCYRILDLTQLEVISRKDAFALAGKVIADRCEARG